MPLQGVLLVSKDHLISVESDSDQIMLSIWNLCLKERAAEDAREARTYFLLLLFQKVIVQELLPGAQFFIQQQRKHKVVYFQLLLWKY